MEKQGLQEVTKGRGGLILRKLFQSNHLILVFLIFILEIFFPLSSSGAEEIKLAVGQSKIIPLSYRLKEIQVADEKIANFRVREAGREIIVTGVTPGLTTLIIWDTSGKKRDEIRIQVTEKDVEELYKQLKSLFGEIEGVTLKIVGTDVFIEGDVYNKADLDRIRAITKSMPQVKNLTKLSPLTLKILAEKIEKTIAMPEVRTKVVGQTIVLEGTVYSKDVAEKALEVARTHYENIQNLIDVRDIPLSVIAIRIEKAIGIPGVRARIEGTKIFIEGYVESEERAERIMKIAKAHSERVESLLEVRKEKLSTVAANIEKAIGIPGVRVRGEGNKIILEGLVESQDLKNRASKIAQAFTEDVVNLIQVRAATPRLSAIEIQKAIGLPGITVQVVGDKVVLRGEVESQEIAEKAAAIAKIYTEDVISILEVRKPRTPEPREDFTTRPPVATTPPVTAVPKPDRRTIQLGVYAMEIYKDAFRDLGIRWFGSINMDIGQTKSMSPISGTPPRIPGVVLGSVPNLSATLNYFNQKGKGRLLANTNINARNNEKTIFVFGGELAIPVVQRGGGIELQTKEYGFRVILTPSFDPKGNLNTALSIESTLFSRASLRADPELRTNKGNASLGVAKGESIALIGFFEDKASQSIDKIPALGSVPILGELFRSKNFQGNVTDFIIFISPVVFSSTQ